MLTGAFDGDGAAPRSAPDRSDADTTVLERERGASLELRVTLEPKKHGVALTLHYASLDQLHRVLSLRAR